MKVLLFGAGENAKRFLRYSPAAGKLEVTGIVDNDSSKWGHLFEQRYTIEAPAELKAKEWERIVVTPAAYDAILNQLVIEYGIEKEKVVRASNFVVPANANLGSICVAPIETEGLQMAMNDVQKKIGAYWDKQNTKKSQDRYRWWLSPTIIRHINYKICGEYLDGLNAGALKLLKEKIGDRVLESAVSVGCGNGTKEMELLEKGLVENISCYELSEIRIEEGKRIAQEKGVSDRIVFHLGNFYESEENREEYFDMVFWDDSLHHMLDAEEAVKISHKILKTGGIFFCNDYVGASRFQWSDLEIAMMNGVRASLPDEIFQNHNRWVIRPDIERMKESDYSEAADVENIIPSIKKFFSSPRIINTGGTIYHPCLSDILTNIPEDSELLEYCLSIDDDVASHGFWHYAFILAEKQN